MKKRIIIVILFLLLFVGIVLFIIFNNRVVSVITLDINPSIEISLTNKDKVKKVVALNDDGKDIISNNISGKSIDKALGIITDNVIKKGYAKDDHVVIIIYSEGNIDNKDIENSLRKSFEEKNINTDVIVIDRVTNEDKQLAKKYNISLSKAAYINSIKKENDNIDVDNLINKPVKELKETKDRGLYCEKDYNLEGDFCFKEIRREKASSGMVCPRDYYEYNGKCYYEVASEESNKYICRDEFKLSGNKCIRTITMNAEPSKYSCNKGEVKTRLEIGLTNPGSGDANDIVCVDLSSATHPVSPCEANDGTEYTIVGGVCYWHRAPVIASGCPGKVQVAGECWDNATGIYICPGYRDGKRYSSRSEYCENSIKYFDPIVSEYKCPSDYSLSGSKCMKDEIEDAIHERICPSGYSLVNNDRCIDYNKNVSKENGFVCNKENTRLEGNTCIVYDIVEAISN